MPQRRQGGAGDEPMQPPVAPAGTILTLDGASDLGGLIASLLDPPSTGPAPAPQPQPPPMSGQPHAEPPSPHARRAGSVPGPAAAASAPASSAPRSGPLVQQPQAGLCVPEERPLLAMPAPFYAQASPAFSAPAGPSAPPRATGPVPAAASSAAGGLPFVPFSPSTGGASATSLAGSASALGNPALSAPLPFPHGYLPLDTAGFSTSPDGDPFLLPTASSSVLPTLGSAFQPRLRPGLPTLSSRELHAHLTSLRMLRQRRVDLQRAHAQCQARIERIMAETQLLQTHAASADIALQQGQDGVAQPVQEQSAAQGRPNGSDGSTSWEVSRPSRGLPWQAEPGPADELALCLPAAGAYYSQQQQLQRSYLQQQQQQQQQWQQQQQQWQQQQWQQQQWRQQHQQQHQQQQHQQQQHQQQQHQQQQHQHQQQQQAYHDQAMLRQAYSDLLDS